MSGWARPGVKCVCIQSGRLPGGGHDPLFGWPVAGQVYTVHRVGLHRRLGHTVLFLKELQNPAKRDGVDDGWRIARFRPLVPPKTQEQDMEHFLPLLKTRELVE